MIQLLYIFLILIVFYFTHKLLKKVWREDAVINKKEEILNSEEMVKDIKDFKKIHGSKSHKADIDKFINS